LSFRSLHITSVPFAGRFSAERRMGEMQLGFGRLPDRRTNSLGEPLWLEPKRLPQKHLGTTGG
jgi:hypothetical protein